jgi:branched-chain amino acid transport system substrate-binding protein
MNKRIFIPLAIVIIALLAWSSYNNPAQHTQTSHIGIILPITGEAAVYGQSAQEAAQLALDVAQEKGINISAVFEDSQLDPAIAVSAAQKLISTQNVKSIIMFSSGETLAVCPVAEENNVVVMTSGSSPQITDCEGDVFRNYPSDIYQGEVLAKKIETSTGKVGLLYINNDYGKGLKEEFRKHTTRDIIEAAHLPEETDFRTQIASLKQSGIESLVLISHSSEAARFLNQLSEQGLSIPILGSEALKEDDLLANLPTSVLNHLTVIAAAQYEGDEAKEFQAAYQAKYGHAPSAFADYVYDNVMFIAEAYDSCKRDATPACIGTYLKTHTITGATGYISFNEKGDVQEKPYDSYAVQDGKFVKVTQ